MSTPTVESCKINIHWFGRKTQVLGSDTSYNPSTPELRHCALEGLPKEAAFLGSCFVCQLKLFVGNKRE